MVNEQFDIRILDLHWVKRDGDDPTDQCAHGAVYLRVGEEIVSDIGNGDWTVSATALNLMRTLDKDYTPGDFAGQLIPCCGFNMYARNAGDGVDICGCPGGIDWTIWHDGDSVVHITNAGEKAVIDIPEYRKKVLLFVDEVELFYRLSKPKEIPTDIEERKGVEAFWAEWHILKQKWS